MWDAPEEKIHIQRVLVRHTQPHSGWGVQTAVSHMYKRPPVAATATISRGAVAGGHGASKQSHSAEPPVYCTAGGGGSSLLPPAPWLLDEPGFSVMAGVGFFILMKNATIIMNLSRRRGRRR